MKMAGQNDQISADEMRQLEEMKKKVMNQVLTKGALERLGRIRLVKPDTASQIEYYLVQLYEAGKISNAIDEEQLKVILQGIASSKRGFNIIR